MDASENLGAGTDFKLFASMVTSKPFENLMANEQNVKVRMKKFQTQVLLIL
jgi:hypothetical protein